MRGRGFIEGGACSQMGGKSPLQLQSEPPEGMQ